MKNFGNISIVIVLVLLLGYFGQAQKAQKVSEVRLKQKFELKTISSDEYADKLRQNSLVNVLLQPKLVFSVD